MQFGTWAAKPAWVEGLVNRKADHISLSYGEGGRVVALVAPHRQHGFTVQFVPKTPQVTAHPDKIMDAVHRELLFYLLYVVGPDSWAFVKYHCQTPANRLSRVHWTWHPSADHD